MSFGVVVADAAATPLASGSVDLVITSPPYFGLREYSGVDGEIGLEGSPAEYIDALVGVMVEMRRVLKPTGSMFVNLGDRYVDGRLLLLPYQFALVVQERAGFTLRSEIVWHKPTGIPENQRNRHRRCHEVWFHLVLDMAGYYSDGFALLDGESVMPASVQTHAPRPYPSLNGVEHPAAFSVQWPRQFVLGWSPPWWCGVCGSPARTEATKSAAGVVGRARRRLPGYRDPAGVGVRGVRYTADGVRCRCDGEPGDVESSVVLDPFGGSGTTAHVASALGRHGISVDVNPAYAELANDESLTDARFRETHGLKRPTPETQGQKALF